jgi:hypothetical protein
MITLDYSELQKLQTSIVVHGWEHKQYGRTKRQWLSQFSEQERKKAASLYPVFYDWYLGNGYPDQKKFQKETVDFINKLVYFFATV